MDKLRTRSFYCPGGISRSRSWFVLWLSLFSLLLLFLLRQVLIDLAVSSKWVLWALSLVALGNIVLIKGLGFTWLSPTLAIGGYLWLLHFGLNFIAPIFPGIMSQFPRRTQWMQYESWAKAAISVEFTIPPFSHRMIRSTVGMKHQRNASPVHPIVGQLFIIISFFFVLFDKFYNLLLPFPILFLTSFSKKLPFLENTE